MAEDLKRLARKAILNTIIYEGAPGKIGKQDGTVYYTDSAGTTHRDKVWVRLSVEGSQTEIVARCVEVNPILHLPVRVADREGTPTVVGINRLYAGGAGGGLAGLPRHWPTHLWLGSDPAILDSRSFMGFGVQPSNPKALTVDVKGGFYRWDGTLKQLADQTSDSLASYRPASSGVRHFVVLCLDRENNAPIIVDGEDKLIAAGPITRGDVDDVTIADAYYPLAAVRLASGQTQIGLADIVQDVRLWGGEASAGSVQGFDAIMTDANGDIMVDGSGNIMVES